MLYLGQGGVLASGWVVANIITAMSKTMIKKAVSPRAIHFFLELVVKVVGKKAEPLLKELVRLGDGDGGGSMDSRPIFTNSVRGKFP